MLTYDTPPARVVLCHKYFYHSIQAQHLSVLLFKNGSTHDREMKQIWTFFDLLNYVTGLVSKTQVFQSVAEAKIKNSSCHVNPQDLDVRATRKGINLNK